MPTWRARGSGSARTILYFVPSTVCCLYGPEAAFSHPLSAPRCRATTPASTRPQPGRIYVAGIDLAGEAEETEDRTLRDIKPRLDSTVVTIAEVDPSKSSSDASPGSLPIDPVIKIVDHFASTGQKHSDLYRQLVHLLKVIWHCRRVVVDATGVGQPVYSFLKESLGSVVSPFPFTSQSKSELGFNLLASVNSSRLKIYACDGSAESQSFWTEMEKARSFYRPSQTLNFYVDPSDGHDDFLMSLALVVEAANQYEPRMAKGR